MSKEDNSGDGKSQDAFASDTPTKDPNADIYENRRPKKIIRVVTVMAYLLSVSFVGILLSAYYIFLWEPPNPRFMQRERLRMDPQMQFLLAPPSEETDLKTDGSFLLQSEVSRVNKPLLGRMTQDTYGDDSVVDSRNKMNREKEERLNMILLKLRRSLMDILRAQNRNLSQETAISSEFNNSFVGMGKVLNSTISRAISQYGESRGNILEKKTYSDQPDLPSEFADPTSMLDGENTSSTIIPGTETNQIPFDRDSVTNVNPIIEGKDLKRKLDPVELYFVRGFSNATTNSTTNVTNGSNRRVFGDKNSFKILQEFLKIDRNKPMKQDKTDGRRFINNDRENDPGNVQTSVNGSIRNPQENYSNDTESSKDQIEQVTRDTVSTDLSSRNLGFSDNPGFHQTPDDSTVIKSRSRTMRTRNSEGERICADLCQFSYGAGINTAARNVTV